MKPISYTRITPNDEITRTFRKITTEDINEMKQVIGVYEEGKNYNIIINGSGTGLCPPTEEDWEKIAGEGIIADNIVFTEFESLPTRVDHMDDPWFPPIGNQYLEGSCTCFSVVYYTKTYQEAKEHGWDLSNAKWELFREPSKEYQDKIFSPDFVYHQVNRGVDEGSRVDYAMDLIHEIGACSWKEMPYDSLDSTSWPSESAFREAPLYRSATGYQWLWMDTDAGINNLKNLLAGGELATITIDAVSYWTGLILDNHWTTDDYHPSEKNHANTVVGYDDNYGPYTEGGKTRYGAFKIVNSWGPLFSTYWISYEAMKRYVEICYFFEDEIDYKPKLVSVFQIDHSKRNDCVISLQLEDDDFTFPINLIFLHNF